MWRSVLLLAALALAAEACSDGRYLLATVCVPCPEGTFQYRVNASFCYDCPAGTFANRTGQSSCALCETGTYCATLACKTCAAPPPGFVVPVGNEGLGPIECDAGTYAVNATECRCAEAGHYAAANHTLQIACPHGSEQPMPCGSYCRARSGSSRAGYSAAVAVLATFTGVLLILCIVRSMNTRPNHGISVRYKATETDDFI